MSNELTKVRVQLLHTKTGEVIEEVDVVTSASSVTFSDGMTFQEKYESGELTGPKGEQGAPFKVYKVYKSIRDMETDFSTNDVPLHGFVMIDTGSVEDVDTAKMFMKGESSWKYITDLSGAQGIQGPKGDPGPQGTPGKDGEDGAPGEDGKSLDYKWDGTKLGIKVEGDSDYTFIDLEGPRGPQGLPGKDGKDGEQGPQGLPGKDGIDGDSVKFGVDIESAEDVRVFFKKV